MSRQEFGSFALLVGGAFLTSLLGFTNAAEPRSFSNSTTLSDPVATLVKDREILGKQLVAILSNEDASNDDRVQAAKLLAKLKYRPAIPVLIRHIDLMPSRFGEATTPIPAALAEFGDDAVPSILHAYLDHNSDDISEKGHRTKIAFFLTITDRTRENARTYMKGIAANATDPEKKRKIEEFLKFRFE